MSLPEPQALNDVKKFHDLFSAYTGTEPHLPSDNVAALRVALLQEEMDELKQAIQDGDLVEIADALTDIQYVLSGAVLAFGMQDCFAELFADVQRSNMSKACPTREIAEQTVAYYKQERDTEGYIVEKDGQFLVHRVEDDKVLKSVKYHATELQPILEKYIKSSNV